MASAEHPIIQSFSDVIRLQGVIWVSGSIIIPQSVTRHPGVILSCSAYSGVSRGRGCCWGCGVYVSGFTISVVLPQGSVSSAIPGKNGTGPRYLNVPGFPLSSRRRKVLDICIFRSRVLFRKLHFLNPRVLGLIVASLSGYCRITNHRVISDLVCRITNH